MRDEQHVAFVEVRYRSTSRFGGAHRQYYCWKATQVDALRQGFSVTGTGTGLDTLAASM